MTPTSITRYEVNALDDLGNIARVLKIKDTAKEAIGYANSLLAKQIDVREVVYPIPLGSGTSTSTVIYPLE